MYTSEDLEEKDVKLFEGVFKKKTDVSVSNSQIQNKDTFRGLKSNRFLHFE